MSIMFEMLPLSKSICVPRLFPPFSPKSIMLRKLDIDPGLGAAAGCATPPQTHSSKSQELRTRTHSYPLHFPAVCSAACHIATTLILNLIILLYCWQFLLLLMNNEQIQAENVIHSPMLHKCIADNSWFCSWTKNVNHQFDSFLVFMHRQY